MRLRMITERSARPEQVRIRLPLKDPAGVLHDHSEHQPCRHCFVGDLAVELWKPVEILARFPAGRRVQRDIERLRRIEDHLRQQQRAGGLHREWIVPCRRSMQH